MNILEIKWTLKKEIMEIEKPINISTKKEITTLTSKKKKKQKKIPVFQIIIAIFLIIIGIVGTILSMNSQ
jgi:hypothetical protein